MKIKLTENQYDRLSGDLMGGSRGDSSDAHVNQEIPLSKEESLLDKLIRLGDHGYYITPFASPEFVRFSKLYVPVETNVYCIFNKNDGTAWKLKGKPTMLLFSSRKEAQEFMAKYIHIPALQNSVTSEYIGFSPQNNINENAKKKSN